MLWPSYLAEWRQERPVLCLKRNVWHEGQVYRFKSKFELCCKNPVTPDKIINCFMTVTRSMIDIKTDGMERLISWFFTRGNCRSSLTRVSFHVEDDRWIMIARRRGWLAYSKSWHWVPKRWKWHRRSRSGLFETVHALSHWNGKCCSKLQNQLHIPY